MRLPLSPILFVALLVRCSAGTSSGATMQEAAGAVASVPESAMPVIQGELAYLEAYSGKYANAEGVFHTEPLNARLKELLGDRHAQLLGDLDVQGPISAKAGHIVISGCRANHCNTHGSIVVVDLVKDHIIVGHRSDGVVSAYTERTDNTAYPVEFLNWVADDSITTGTGTMAAKVAKESGGFAWAAWDKLSADGRAALRRIRSDVRRSVYDALLADIAAGCEVRVTEYDLDGNGQSGVLVSRSGCAEWCGSAGCNISVYEGGALRLSVTDDAESLRPAPNGLFTSKGVLLPLN